MCILEGNLSRLAVFRRELPDSLGNADLDCG